MSPAIGRNVRPQGWPLWKRLNMIICTLGGGAIGIYLQHRAWLKETEKLREEVPKLEKQLELAILKRQKLEQEVARLSRSLHFHHGIPVSEQT